MKKGKERLAGLVEKAIDVLEQEITHGSLGDGTRLRAALTVMERGGLTEKKEVDVTSGGQPILVTNEQHNRSVAALLEALGDSDSSESGP